MMYLTVLTSRRAVFHPNFPTVLTALDIDNTVVANCLIDMRSIETVLLIKVRIYSHTCNAYRMLA